MTNLFDGYTIAVLDASFFCAPFSQALQEGLKNLSIYVSNTFNTEMNQYSEILIEEQKIAYKKNVAFFNKNMRLQTVAVDPDMHLHEDTWGLLDFIVKNKSDTKIIVITANRILIQKIVLSHLPLDIYDLTEDVFIFSSSFLRKEIDYKVRHNNDSNQEPLGRKASAGQLLYLKSGKVIVLGNEIVSGGEAAIFTINEVPEMIAKVFHEWSFTSEKRANINSIIGLNNKLGIDWAAFPVDELYFDASCQKFAGITEHYVNTVENLGDNPLYLGNIVNDPEAEKRLKTRISDSVKLCLNIVRQVSYLNCFGFSISDYNLHNFSTREDKNAIQMWDTHSFSYENYCSAVGEDVRTSREYDLTDKLDVINYSTEMLYIFVFRILSLGDLPLKYKSGTFLYDDPDFIQEKRFLPQNILKLFEQCFHGECYFSTEALMSELCASLDYYKKNPELNKTYSQIIDDIQTEEREKQIDVYIERIEKLRAQEKASHVKEPDNSTGNKIINTKEEDTLSLEELVKALVDPPKVRIRITRKEAKRGCKKEVIIGEEKHIVSIPAKTKDGTILKIGNKIFPSCCVKVLVEEDQNAVAIKSILIFCVIVGLITGFYLLRSGTFEELIRIGSLQDCKGMNIEDGEFKDVLNVLEKKGIPYSLEPVSSNDMEEYGEIQNQNFIDYRYKDIDDRVSFEYAGAVDVKGWKRERAVKEYEDAGWKTECEYKTDWDNKIDTVTDQIIDEDEKTVKFIVSEGVGEEKTDDIDARLSIIFSDISIKKNEEAEIFISCIGEDLPENKSLTARLSNSLLVNFEWGDWIGNTDVTAKISGEKSCSGYIRFYLISNSDPEKIYDYKDVFVKID